MSEPLPIRIADARIDWRYVEQVRRRTYDEGEKKLMLAVLQEALNTFVQYLSATDVERSHRFQEVEKWFWEDNDEWLFSFRNISETLGLSHSYFLDKLMKMKRDKRGDFGQSRHYKVKPFRIGRTAYRTRYSALGKGRYIADHKHVGRKRSSLAVQ